MTSTALDAEPETPAEVLTCLADAQAMVDAGEVAKLRMALAWAAMHSTDTLTPGIEDWQEGSLPLAGEGAPEVAEFCVAELAAVFGVSTESGAAFLGDAIELAHRLPRLWGQVMAGRVRAWRARRVAQQTKALSPAAAAFVDTHVAAVAGGVGPAALDRIIAAALAHHDPDTLEQRRRDAMDHRRVIVELDAVSGDGAVDVLATLDLADAHDLDDALNRRAAHLGRLGAIDSHDVRRAIALGDLARADLVLDLVTEDADGKTVTTKGRQVVVHVHLADASVARLERGRRAITVDQVRAWCQTPGTSVVIKPIVDLAGSEHVEAHEVPARMREQVVLRDLACVFPWCGRPSRTHTDLDHTEAWAPGQDPPVGTTPSNLAPLCRKHHRHKTHGRWRYRRTGPTTYQWTSPHGRTFTVHRGITRPS